MHKNFLNILLLSLILSCDNNEIIRAYPTVSTLEVANITEGGATFQAEILSSGNQPISNYGFSWGERNNPNVDEDESVIFGGDTTAFKFHVKTTLKKDVTYYLRAFVQNEEFIVYGKNVSFISLGSGAPKIESVSPENVSYFDTLFITGNNFSKKTNNNIVTLGEVEAPLVFISDTLLKATIPELIADSVFSVSVSIFGNTATSTEKQHFIPPSIHSISKNDVVYGDTITLIGNHFGYNSSLNTIKLNDIEVEQLNISSTAISVVVPVIDGSEVDVSVTNSLGQSNVFEKALSILPPKITQINPEEAFWNDPIDIVGENFGYFKEGVEVYFNNKKADIVDFSNEKIVAEVPEGVNNPIEVKVLVTYQLSNKSSFYYLGPEITSINPGNGTWGDIITIKGNNFSAIQEENILYLNDVETDIITYSPTEISFQIPNGLLAQKITVLLEVNNRTISRDFILNKPIIESISPQKVTKIGSEIIISGQNFNPIKENNKVSFMGKLLEIVSVSPNEIIAKLVETSVDNPLVSQKHMGPLKVTNGIGCSSSQITIDLETPWSYLPNINFGSIEAHFQVNNKAYAISQNGTVYEFDFINESWNSRSTFPGEKGYDGNRHQGTGFALNGDIYYGMGLNTVKMGSCSTNPNVVCPPKKMDDFWKYSPLDNSWIQLSNAPFVGNEAKGISLTSSYLLSPSGLYEYSPSSDEWVSKTNIEETYFSFSLHLANLNGNLLACITESSGKKFHVYNPSLDSWLELFSDGSLKYVGDIQVLGNDVYYTKISFPSTSSNEYVSQVYRFNSNDLIAHEVPIPSDQIIYLPFSYEGKMYLDGNDNVEFYKYNPNFN